MKNFVIGMLLTDTYSLSELKNFKKSKIINIYECVGTDENDIISSIKIRLSTAYDGLKLTERESLKKSLMNFNSGSIDETEILNGAEKRDDLKFIINADFKKSELKKYRKYKTIIKEYDLKDLNGVMTHYKLAVYFYKKSKKHLTNELECVNI